nr:DUF5320 domain-containing protein [uncultured Methanoregula sp.]
MPNFDGTGPLKRGRVIGRGLGSCKKGDSGCERRAVPEEEPTPEEEKRSE